LKIPRVLLYPKAGPALLFIVALSGFGTKYFPLAFTSSFCPAGGTIFTCNFPPLVVLLVVCGFESKHVPGSKFLGSEFAQSFQLVQRIDKVNGSTRLFGDVCEAFAFNVLIGIASCSVDWQRGPVEWVFVYMK
jgi:hypothetical protein